MNVYYILNKSLEKTLLQLQSEHEISVTRSIGYVAEKLYYGICHNLKEEEIKEGIKEGITKKELRSQAWEEIKEEAKEEIEEEFKEEIEEELRSQAWEEIKEEAKEEIEEEFKEEIKQEVLDNLQEDIDCKTKKLESLKLDLEMAKLQRQIRDCESDLDESDDEE